jgi:ribonuclease VapC
VIVIDSSALVAILLNEPEALSFAETVGAAEGVVMSAVTCLETPMVLAGRKGKAAWPLLDALIARAKIEIIPFDAEQARLARDAFLKYGKGHHAAGLNFGDCAAYALAKSKRAPLLYKGADFARTDVVSAL